MTTQLRRYEIVDGEIDAFAEWFPTIAKVREKFGFKIEFAYVDRETNQFVWAVSHPGNYDEAFEEYNGSPERAAAFEGQPKRVGEMHVAMVDPLVF